MKFPTFRRGKAPAGARPRVIRVRPADAAAYNDLVRRFRAKDITLAQALQHEVVLMNRLGLRPSRTFPRRIDRFGAATGTEMTLFTTVFTRDHGTSGHPLGYVSLAQRRRLEGLDGVESADFVLLGGPGQPPEWVLLLPGFSGEGR